MYVIRISIECNIMPYVTACVSKSLKEEGESEDAHDVLLERRRIWEHAL